MAAALISAFSLSPLNPSKTLSTSLQELPLRSPRLFFKHRNLPSLMPLLLSNGNGFLKRVESVSSNHLSTAPIGTRNYEFLDSISEVELRLDIGALDIQSSSDIFVDVDETSLLIRVKASGSLINLMETNRLFDKIKPSETVWYIDEDQLVVNLKKYDTELKWPDIKESWDSLTSGILQLLKGTSIYIIGDSTEINQEVAKELAMGIGYTPLYTSELLERYAKKSIDSWVVSEGADSVAEAEGAVLDGLSSHVRAVVATLGGLHGAARRPDKWRHLYAGFTVWLSKSEAPDEASAKEAARRHIQDGSIGYTNAEVVVKLGGWDLKHARDVAQGCLSALKQLILSDNQLTGKKSLYIRLGCRGDWPNIKPPGWDPSSGVDPSPES
ncbi:probable inactive shikimate kinase like 2, chloroplastic [Elaeis guineensis]|uniref:Probable inactive shikimate kinase like 2, chloroplastic n=1 Tax=Elaeis guineensis var. tenera TaxID=51953 RepID=A0A6I9R5H1_ELAGV|nr:probable inactive shikimate kinase like 2, chloroplastic [Elaeis guineensis]